MINDYPCAYNHLGNVALPAAHAPNPIFFPHSKEVFLIGVVHTCSCTQLTVWLKLEHPHESLLL